jgi:hypothetical protein
MTMRERPAGEIIEQAAKDPEGDLACDFTIATDMARKGIRENLARGIVPPVRPIADGVEVTFRRDAWDAVQRYVQLESGCCSFLTLSARRDDDAVCLRITGRPEAQEFIRNIFATPGPAAPARTDE